MDDPTFDDVIRKLGAAVTRRGIVAGCAAALGFVYGGGAAKRHRRRCGRPRRICANNVQCCSNQCCLPTPTDPAAAFRCAPKGDVCCGADEGGGSCPADRTCCPPTASSPDGSCCAVTGPGLISCCPANAVQPSDYCCSGDRYCCEEGTGCCGGKLDGGAEGGADGTAHGAAAGEAIPVEPKR